MRRQRTLEGFLSNFKKFPKIIKNGITLNNKAKPQQLSYANALYLNTKLP